MKKSSLVLLSCSLFAATSFVFADEVVKTFPAGGAKDVLANPHTDPVNPERHDNAGGAIKVKKSCTAANGKIAFEGDAAYETCSKEKLEKPKK